MSNHRAQTPLTFDRLKQTLTFKGALVEPEAVRNALVARSRAGSMQGIVSVLRRIKSDEQTDTERAVDDDPNNPSTELLPDSHESELFAFFGDAEDVARLIGWQTDQVSQAQAAVTKAEESRSLNAEIVHIPSEKPEICLARGIAVHPGNNFHLAGGRHPTLKHLQGLVRRLSRQNSICTVSSLHASRNTGGAQAVRVLCSAKQKRNLGKSRTRSSLQPEVGSISRTTLAEGCGRVKHSSSWSVQQCTGLILATMSGILGSKPK